MESQRHRVPYIGWQVSEITLLAHAAYYGPSPIRLEAPSIIRIFEFPKTLNSH